MPSANITSLWHQNDLVFRSHLQFRDCLDSALVSLKDGCVITPVVNTVFAPVQSYGTHALHIREPSVDIK